MTDAFVDTHLHCWDRARFPYPWLEGDEVAPQRFVPADAPDAARIAAVFMEADVAAGHAEAEAAWAASLPGVTRVVAHAPIEEGGAVAAQLDRLAARTAVVAVRRLLQDEPAERFAEPALREGLRLVGERGLVFDACVRHHQLGALLDLVRAAPGTTIVLDHLGKPPVRAGWTDDVARAWVEGVRRIAAEPNTIMKLSGLRPESAPGPLAPQARPYLDSAIDAFGPARCLAGSDWPVSRPVAEPEGYGDWFALVAEGLSPDDRDQVLRRTATRVYRIPEDDAA